MNNKYQTLYSRKFRTNLRNKEHNRRTTLRYKYRNKSCNVFYEGKIFIALDYIDAMKFIYYKQNFTIEYEIKSSQYKLISNDSDINVILHKITGTNITDEDLTNQIGKIIHDNTKRWKK